MSPNNIPPAIKAIPPRTSNRCALSGASARAMSPETCAAGPGTPFAACSLEMTELLVSRHLRRSWPEGGHHVLCEHLLRLDALPVFDAAEVRHDRQFSNPALRLQILHLRDHFLRRS